MARRWHFLALTCLVTEIRPSPTSSAKPLHKYTIELRVADAGLILQTCQVVRLQRRPLALQQKPPARVSEPRLQSAELHGRELPRQGKKL